MRLSGRYTIAAEAGGKNLGGHESECAVIHAGIYYEPGSLKAQMCVRGKELLYKYIREHSIAHSQLGKVITCRCAHQ